MKASLAVHPGIALFMLVLLGCQRGTSVYTPTPVNGPTLGTSPTATPANTATRTSTPSPPVTPIPVATPTLLDTATPAPTPTTTAKPTPTSASSPARAEEYAKSLCNFLHSVIRVRSNWPLQHFDERFPSPIERQKVIKARFDRREVPLEGLIQSLEASVVPPHGLNNYHEAFLAVLKLGLGEGRAAKGLEKDDSLNSAGSREGASEYRSVMEARVAGAIALGKHDVGTINVLEEATNGSCGMSVGIRAFVPRQ